MLCLLLRCLGGARRLRRRLFRECPSERAADEPGNEQPVLSAERVGRVQARNEQDRSTAHDDDERESVRGNELDRVCLHQKPPVLKQNHGRGAGQQRDDVGALIERDDCCDQQQQPSDLTRVIRHA